MRDLTTMSKLSALLCAMALVAGAGVTARPAAAAGPSDAVPAGIESAVVKVFASQRPPDLMHPWSKAATTEVSGSGVVIDGRRILTNAHVVSYASEVQIQGSQGGDRIAAKVAYAAPGIDLAILTLDDEAFFKTHAPIVRSNTLPTSKDSVLVYGYPTGGQTLSVTKGIVSRTEFVSYNYPASGLRVQIDAAINPGNSGGPAVVGDRMIGVAFSRLGSAENIGYIIPNEEIELFLKDIADGHYDGKPALFAEAQTLENPGLRRFLKLPAEARGVVATGPTPYDADNPLKRWDLVTKIAGTPIDDLGEVTVGPNLRVRFQYLVQKYAANGTIGLSILRDGHPMDVQVPVHPERALLIPDLRGTYPPYFIYGPLVFSVATQPFVSMAMARPEWATALTVLHSPLITERFAAPTPERSELVVITSPFFPDKLAKGYSSHVAAVVATVNGIPIRSLAHLVEVLRDAQGEFMLFEFAGTSSESLVFPRAEMLAATETILTDNGIRAQGSAELLKIWEAKAAH